METHMGDMPLNARVKVTYGDTKKVDFSYPRGDKYNSAWKKFLIKFAFIWGYYICFLMILGFIFFIGWTIFNWQTIAAEMAIQEIENPPHALTAEEIYNGMWTIIIFGVIPFILTIIFTKYSTWFDKWFPKANAAIVKKYYVKIEKLSSPVYELQLFKNVILDYKATEDFGAQLQEVEVIDLEYHRYTKIKDQVKDNGPQSKWWKAVFRFKEVPTSGYLEIYYH